MNTKKTVICDSLNQFITNKQNNSGMKILIYLTVVFIKELNFIFQKHKIEDTVEMESSL